MASQAEVDLVVNATRTLPQLERDLDRVLNAAQADMSDLDVDAVLRSSQSLNDMERDLDRIIRQATDDADPVVVAAAINQRDSLRAMQRDLDAVVRAVNTDGSADAITVLTALNVPDAIADLHDDVVTVVRAVQATTPDIEIQLDVDRRGALRGLTSTLSSATSGLGALGLRLGSVGAAAGTAAPLLAGVVAAVEQLGPAAAVGTSALLAMQLASGALKIGMMGVSEAITAAFEPDADMEAVNEALARLSPSARAAATEIIGMKSAFKDLQLDVQESLFKGFAGEIRALSKGVLPDLRRGLVDSAGALNQMARGISQAGQALSDSGVLGKAIKSSTNGLENLADVPGQALAAFGMLAAAAGPSFERITEAAAGVATSVTKSLAGAFQSGALETAIEDAVDSIAQLGRVAENVFGGLSNIINAVSIDGQGLFGVLEKLSQGFEDLTGTKEFQGGLRALAETMAAVYKTAGPLLAQAFKILGGVLVELSGPAQVLVKILGDALGSILDALGPVLVELAGAFGKLVVALSPIITLAGELIAGILPVLTPLFKALGDVFVAMSPFIAQVANILGSILLPVLAELPAFVEAVIAPFVKLAEDLFPVLTEQLLRMAPDFAALGTQLAAMLVELTPIAVEFAKLIALIDGEVIPIIAGVLIGTLALLAKGLTLLASVFTEVTIPIIQVFIDLLQGDFRNGNEAAKKNVQDLAVKVRTAFDGMVHNVQVALNRYVQELRSKVARGALDFVSGIRGMVDNAMSYVRDIPNRVRGALGNLGRILFSSGQEIVNGLISGLVSKLAQLRDIASSIGSTVTNAVKGTLGIRSPSTVFAEIGRNIVEGAHLGIKSEMPDLMKGTSVLFGSLPRLAAPSPVAAPTGGYMAAPAIYVTIGNEAVDRYVTTRIDQATRTDRRTTAQGVRI